MQSFYKRKIKNFLHISVQGSCFHVVILPGFSSSVASLGFLRRSHSLTQLALTQPTIAQLTLIQLPHSPRPRTHTTAHTHTAGSFGVGAGQTLRLRLPGNRLPRAYGCRRQYIRASMPHLPAADARLFFDAGASFGIIYHRSPKHLERQKKTR